jgi:hypothetical protein
MDIESILENEPLAGEAEVDQQQKIATRAYELWLERGCPIGSPDEDWFRAEQELRAGTAAMTASE